MNAVRFGGVYVPIVERADDRPPTRKDWQTAEALLKQGCHNRHYFHNRPGGVPFWFEDDALGQDASTYKPVFEKLKQDLARITPGVGVKNILKNVYVYIVKNPLGKLEQLENKLIAKAQYLKLTLHDGVEGQPSVVKRIF